MLELLLIGLLTLFFIRPAEAENESGLIWGALTAGLPAGQAGLSYAVCAHLPSRSRRRVFARSAAFRRSGSSPGGVPAAPIANRK